MNPSTHHRPDPRASWIRRHRARLALLAASLGAAALVVSCATEEGGGRSFVLPPSIPGAEYVGSESCEQCHDPITKSFVSSPHARLVAHGPHSVEVGCESCHGPASVHVESGGAARTLINPDRNPDVCYTCHLNLRAQFALPHTHPVGENRLGCSACHPPHSGDALTGTASSIASANQACLACHRPQRGPHIFEHEAMREGCLTCHAPHGSVNQKMLTERNAVLCLKCHFQQQIGPGQIAIGAIDHTAFLSRGTCWSAGCHEAVHGSQVSSSLRF
ncbi:MAG: cytochrome c3 family protein [Limisphaerales bacterium]